jgi:predicted Fe-Mo cluster-binding NifX family protein
MMKKKIAVPTSDGVLDAHFGHCSQFAMVDVENNEIKGISYIDAPPHQPGLLPPWLAERGSTDIIAGGMGQRAIQLFNEQGVNVFVGAPSLTPEDLVSGLLKGTLTFSANYCDH